MIWISQRTVQCPDFEMDYWEVGVHHHWSDDDGGNGADDGDDDNYDDGGNDGNSGNGEGNDSRLNAPLLIRDHCDTSLLVKS